MLLINISAFVDSWNWYRMKLFDDNTATDLQNQSHRQRRNSPIEIRFNLYQVHHSWFRAFCFVLIISDKSVRIDILKLWNILISYNHIYNSYKGFIIMLMQNCLDCRNVFKSKTYDIWFIEKQIIFTWLLDCSRLFHRILEPIQ